MSLETSSRFRRIIGFVLSSEGGYANHPNDPGGPTKFGIAANYNQDILRQLLTPNIRDLTLEQAKYIYYQKYWLPNRCEQIPDLRLAYIHFDACVNHGGGAAARMLNSLDPDPFHFEGDGKNQGLFAKLCTDYLMIRLSTYTHDRNAASFLAGWVNRIIGINRNLKQLTV